MKTKLPTLLLLIISALFVGAATCAAQVSVGITIGAPPPPRVLAVRPVAPGPDFVWLDGYWFVDGHKWKWHPGYWTRAPYVGAHWVGPRYEGGKFYAGYWDGEHGQVAHDHRWDKEHDRDYNRHH
jgi:WXXGXW repeat (2 copies)